MSEDFEVRNRVLGALRPDAQIFLSKRSLTREMHAGDIIYEDGAPFTHAVFPHEGVLSLMAVMQDGRSVEKTSIGLEGFLGFVLLMGGGNAISRSVVQVPGYASWIAIKDLDQALDLYPCVRQAMLRYAKFLIAQTMETVACNSLHVAEQRVCRWLLHAHDRVAGDRFQITQQSVSEVLGLRRATVSEVCSRLSDAGIITYSRACLEVLDRRALEGRSCECYERISRLSGNRSHTTSEQSSTAPRY
ncbi:helix-turn-helix domain-containing protein [Ciceribacter thiooxidans]|uniref:Crp/Fnr family transcriptional regulator n=1 Tax=Ciceribacter thiooxidans TaxID=1969821 RepID=A0ABV7IAY6_9HYPH